MQRNMVLPTRLSQLGPSQLYPLLFNDPLSLGSAVYVCVGMGSSVVVWAAFPWPHTNKRTILPLPAASSCHCLQWGVKPREQPPVCAGSLVGWILCKSGAVTLNLWLWYPVMFRKQLCQVIGSFLPPSPPRFLLSFLVKVSHYVALTHRGSEIHPPLLWSAGNNGVPTTHGLLWFLLICFNCCPL